MQRKSCTSYCIVHALKLNETIPRGYTTGPRKIPGIICAVQV